MMPMPLVIFFMILFDASVWYAPFSEELRAVFYVASVVVLICCAWATAVEKQSARVMPRAELQRRRRFGLDISIAQKRRPK